jgi:hypothetical protein
MYLVYKSASLKEKSCSLLYTSMRILWHLAEWRPSNSNDKVATVLHGFNPSIIRHSAIWGVADEAVLSTKKKKKRNSKKYPFGTLEATGVVILPRCEKPEVLWPEVVLRSPPSMPSQPPLCLSIKMARCYRSLPWALVNPHFKYLKQYCTVAMDKTSAQTQLKLLFAQEFFRTWSSGWGQEWRC